MVLYGLADYHESSSGGIIRFIGSAQINSIATWLFDLATLSQASLRWSQSNYLE